GPSLLVDTGQGLLQNAVRGLQRRHLRGGRRAGEARQLGECGVHRGVPGGLRIGRRRRGGRTDGLTGLRGRWHRVGKVRHHAAPAEPVAAPLPPVVFLATVFFATVFFATVFFATVFFAGAFLAVAFLAVAFFTALFFAAVFS